VPLRSEQDNSLCSLYYCCPVTWLKAVVYTRILKIDFGEQQQLEKSMQEFLQSVFASNPFIPHGHCYLWKPGLLWLHIVSDSLIALAYYSIPIALIYFVQQRRDLPFKGIFLLFGAFIVFCGTTHIMSIWTLWHPALLAVRFTESLYRLCLCVYSFCSGADNA
jgi:hypothetical protein